MYYIMDANMQKTPFVTLKSFILANYVNYFITRLCIFNHF